MSDNKALRRYKKDYLVTYGVRDSREHRINAAIARCIPLIVAELRKDDNPLSATVIARRTRTDKDIVRRALVVMRHDKLIEETVADVPCGELPPGSLKERRYKLKCDRENNADALSP